MTNIKMVELYSVLLILCTSLIVFGIFQMQSAMAAVLNETEIFTTQMILRGVQISAVGLVLSALILFLFFRTLKKRLPVKENAAKKP